MVRNRFALFCGALTFFSWNSSILAQGFSPADAVKRMKPAPGLEVKLCVSEPDLRQPVTMSFDGRGRLWVIQYLQYPKPAGLKPLKVDQYLRTVYDRIPEPPPHGPKGADRITIYEDKKGDGVFTKVRDFVTGLNLASGMALGYGGVFVAQPPYLLYYPDKNGDDQPDGDPEVLLSGFGMHDAHAFPNSLQWGPDGWLYGAQGSTVTSTIRGISFQQGIWRYHPRTKEFELFAEGGGNTWGLDFDRQGQILAGTNWGGAAMLHQVQGAYYIKGFAKHGELHNPHTYGYFDHVPCPNFQGGHVTCGGIVYQGGTLPASYANTYIACNPLSNALYWYTLEPKGCSFTSRQAGTFLSGNDTWFRPVDCLVGPDGAVYIADWYDKRINHVDPVDNWDRTNGRIYKVQAVGAGHPAPFNLDKLDGNDLVKLLNHSNSWFSGEARRVLAERRDSQVVPLLKEILAETHNGDLALQTLWTLYVSGGFDDKLALTLLHHPSPPVRNWTVRLLGDPKKVSPEIARSLAALAESEKDAGVRCQLACTAKRLPGVDCLPVVKALLNHPEDVNDPFIPMLLWWALEDKAVAHRDAVLNLMENLDWGHYPIVEKYLVERLARRYMAEGGKEDLMACTRLLKKAPSEAFEDTLVRGMEKALEGRVLEHAPDELAPPINVLWQKHPQRLSRFRLAIRLGSHEAYQSALQRIGDIKTEMALRQGLIEIIGQLGRDDAIDPLLKLLDGDQPAAIRTAALAALQNVPDPRPAEKLLRLYPSLPGDMRSRSQALFFSRPATCLKFLELVDRGAVAPKEVPLDQLRRALLHKDERIAQLVDKHWGKVGQESPGEKKSRIASILHILGMGKGDVERGHALFVKTCSTCHTLFNEGGKVGPELTGHDRKNLPLLVHDVVDPSALIRKEFVAFNLMTRKGLVFTGLIAEETPQAVTLLDAKAERLTIARKDIEDLTASPISLMPEKLLDEYDDQQIRDLFSYLQGDKAISPPKETFTPAEKTKPMPLKVCLISGSVEYKSDESLAAFQQYLEKNYAVSCSRAFRKTDEDLPGLENLETCDVAFFFTRRLQIDGDQLDRIKKYCGAGKPIVAVRTASHGFQKWLAFDKEILGGDYQNHYGEADAIAVEVVEENRDQPILSGVKHLSGSGSLYKNPKPAADIKVLLKGNDGRHQEPIAWVRERKNQRIFYTSLGHPKDFEKEDFRRLLAQALFWTSRKEVTPRK